MWTVLPSPIGDLRIVERDDRISAIEFSPFRQPADGRPLGARDDDHPVLAAAVTQLTAYFARDLKDFDLPLAPLGTEFQQRVWQQLATIAYGDTASYGEIAGRLVGGGAMGIDGAMGRRQRTSERDHVLGLGDPGGNRLMSAPRGGDRLLR